MGKKSTNQELEKRIQEVADWMLANPLASRFKAHDEFCEKFNVTWSYFDASYAVRAKELNKKRLSLSRDEMAELGRSVLMDLVQHPSPMIRLKAEARLSELAGYNAPPRIPEDAEGKPMQFVPLTVNPKDIAGGK